MAELESHYCISIPELIAAVVIIVLVLLFNWRLS